MNLELRRRFMSAIEKKTPSRLPEEYQEVKYITIINDAEYGYRNKISFFHANMLISFDRVDAIEFKASIPQLRTNTMLFCGYVESGAGSSPFMYAREFGAIYDSGSDISFSQIGTPTFDGNPFVVTLDNIVTSTINRYITFGAWNDSTYSSTMDWYYVKLSKGGVDIADLVPCYRISDNAVGFYDLVSGKFVPPHKASNIEAFVVGDKV